ncbi:hypothetical protein C4D60_Mb07t16570 [Musa balbisiana]|uniref:Uncharacterized protein n=1 Tax=Musa balbisiana TaxID=52838 RepID=A0A4S8JG16_MUSBA|nr:hypothetical protein C4D60_Mb07t16570 [Musa balbisiana]
METTRAESLMESHRCLLEMIAGALFGQEASGFIGHRERTGLLQDGDVPRSVFWSASAKHCQVKPRQATPVAHRSA